MGQPSLGCTLQSLHLSFFQRESQQLVQKLELGNCQPQVGAEKMDAASDENAEEILGAHVKSLAKQVKVDCVDDPTEDSLLRLAGLRQKVLGYLPERSNLLLNHKLAFAELAVSNVFGEQPLHKTEFVHVAHASLARAGVC